MNAWRTIRMPEAALRLGPIMASKLTLHAPFDNMSALLAHESKYRSSLISRLQQQISLIHSIHNQIIPPAASLPPELIIEIFSYLYDSSTEPHRNRNFLSALLTCKGWHEVASKAPRFWTTCRINNATALKTSLQRSGVRPLSLSLENAPIGDSDKVVSLVKPHVRRVRSLVAHHRDTDELEDLLNSLNVPAPDLEVLRVSNLQIAGENADLTGLFAGVMPSLRTLDLTRAWLPVNRSWTGGLQDLTLFNTDFTLPDILNLLAECPALQALTIEGSNTWPEAESVPDNTVIPLPKLQRLKVQTNPVEDTFYFFSHLLLPESATLRLVVDVPIELSVTHTFDLPQLNNAHNLPCVTGLKRFEVLWDEGGAVIMRGYRNAEEFVSPDVVVELQGADSLADIPRRDGWPFDFSAVEVLVIQGGKGEQRYWSRDNWDILGDFPALKLFRSNAIDDLSLISLTRALNTVFDHGPQGPILCFCPQLGALELFDFRWGHKFAEELAKMITTRDSLGGLESVDIYNAQGGPEAMAVACSKHAPLFHVNFHES